LRSKVRITVAVPDADTPREWKHPGLFMMANPEISLAISATSFGMVVGFLTGYAARAYISYRRRHRRKETIPEALERMQQSSCARSRSQPGRRLGDRLVRQCHRGGA